MSAIMLFERTPTIFASIGQGLGRGESTLGFWRIQVIGWLCLAMVGFLSRWVAFGSATAAFWLTLGLEPLACLLTSAAAVWHGRSGRGSHAPIGVLACAVAMCVLAAALLAGVGQAIHSWVPYDSYRTLPDNQYQLGFIYYLGILSIWTLIYFGVAAELMARTERLSKTRAEANALRLELQHLQSQIEPHFLFNSLNTILAEIGDRPGVAEQMTRRLADYLRYSLDRRGRGLGRVDEEIEAAQAYIAILALRFERHLECRCHVDPASLVCMIPHMTLQGLVENAVKHGMQSPDARFVINIRTRMRGDELVISVDNPGRLQVPYDQAEGGIGLANLGRRLALYYPDRHSFALHQRANKIEAEIRLRGEPAEW